MNKITPYKFEIYKNGKLNNKTMLVTGGSRGIGIWIKKKNYFLLMILILYFLLHVIIKID